MKRITEEQAREEFEIFTENIHSVMLSTVDENAEPFISYAPFVEDENHNYYVYVSAVVPHAHNMNTTKKASIMFIEDESKAGHIFGRKRLYFQATAEKFEENDKKTEKINQLFTDRFGGKVSFLMSMPDFRIYKLKPKEGNLVLGFGSAYKISEDRKSFKLKNASHGTSHEKNMK